MSYIDDLSKVNVDILKRKEFFELRVDPDFNFKNREDIFSREGLLIHGTQQFVRNFMNPDTPYKRLLLKWDTGTGKTIGALASATKFVEAYQNIYEQDEFSPSIFIIGFTGQNIKQELLKHPEFGFITYDEQDELKRLERQAMKGFANDIKHYRDLYQQIQRRITSKKDGGFYKFYGYQEFVNRIFTLDDSSQNITDFYKEDIFNSALKDGKIKVNINLLDAMANSLLICDEIHNVYNANEKNNYGVAIQYILDNVQNLRALFLSATPINTSPTEVIDIINLLTSARVKKSDLFSGKKLLPDALEKMVKYFEGRVSFLQDADIKNYPKRIFVGETIPEINYLKFIRCEMSALQYKTYEHSLEQKDHNIHDETTLYDIVFPDPNSNFGIYNKNDLRRIKIANKSFLNKNKIELSDHGIISGQFLEEGYVRKFSGKYYKLIELLHQMEGKALIYHNNVRMSGVLLVKELLLRNHFIDEFADPTDDTLCYRCNKPLKGHKEDHTYYPSRVALVYGELPKSAVQTIKTRFNATSNAFGQYLRILVASQIFREGHDLKCTNNIFILTMPINIPLTIQTIGRVVRKKSHLDLPPERRYVNVHILVSSLPGKKKLSNEERIYANKIEDYKIIQQIEMVMNKNAVDAFLNYEVVNKFQQRAPALGNLYFELDDHVIKKNKSITLGDLSTITFDINNYNEDEIIYIFRIMRQLLIMQPIWTYDDLWTTVRNPPFSVETNPSLFSEENFAIVLAKYLRKNTMDIFSNLSGFIQKDDMRYKLEHVGDYFILVPHTTHSIIDFESFLRTPKKDKIIINFIAKYEESKDMIFSKWFGEFQTKLPNNVFDAPADVFYMTTADFYYEICKKVVEKKIKLRKDVFELFEILGLFAFWDPMFGIKKTDAPIGYVTRKTYEIFVSNKWTTFSKEKKIKFIPENNFIGYFDETIQFKIRKPHGKSAKDARKIETGMVCTTLKKDKLVQFAKQLNIAYSNRVKSICEQLLNELMLREINAHTANKNQKIKWFYMFNEEESI